jgi:hypothetical protein
LTGKKVYIRILALKAYSEASPNFDDIHAHVPGKIIHLARDKSIDYWWGWLYRF